MNTPSRDRAMVVAHEMRSPLAAIGNALDVLRVAASDPGIVDEMRGRIARQLHQLTRLVDDLLDVQHPANVDFGLRKVRFDLRSCVSSAIETTQPLIDSLGHSLTTAFSATAATVEGDADRLSQVFVNLLGNAARYTEPRGQIALSMERIRAGVAVKVQDNGTGISADLLPRVFEMSVRGAEQVGSGAGGMGIGLAVARRIVEAHGGTISASSHGPGKGSLFVVQLPAAGDEPSAG